MSKMKINFFSGGLEFSPGSTHYLLSIRNSASNATECERNLKLLLMVGASVDEEETPRSLTAAAMVSVNKPRRQLQRRLVEEEVGQRSKDTLLYQRDQLRLSMSRQSEEAGHPIVSDSRILSKLVSSSNSSKLCVPSVILLIVVFTLHWLSENA